MEKIGRALARRPVAPVLACLALAAVGAFFAARVGVDPGNEALFLTNDPARAALAEFDRAFSGDEVVVVALEGAIFTEGGLARLEQVTTEAAAVSGVAVATSITNAKNVYQGPLEVYAWPPYDKVKDGDETIDELRAELLAEPLFVGNLVSNNGAFAAVICELSSRDPATIAGLRAVATRAEGDGFHTYVAGFPVERVDFARFIDRDQSIFVPLVAIVLALVTGLFFRQFWGVALALAVVGVSVVLTMGLAGALGKNLNALTSMVKPVVMVVAVAASVNILAAYTQMKTEKPGASRDDLVAAALGRVGLPCLLTTLTCLIGFASLAASDVPAIADFGLLTAFGVGASYVAAMLLLPALLGLSWESGPGALHARPGKIEHVLAHTAPFLQRRRYVVLGIALLLSIGAAVGISRIRVETDILSQLPPTSDLARSTRAIDRALAGVNTLEVLFEGPPGAFRKIEAVRAIAGMEEKLGATAGVQKTVSIADILSKISEVKKRGRALPVDQEALDYELGLLDQAAKKEGAASPLRIFLSADASRARLTARLSSMPASRCFAVIQAVRAAARELSSDLRAADPRNAGIRAEPTGQFVLLQDMTADLPFAQIRGLAVATALIVLSIGAIFRSIRLAALAAVPASLPILFVYGLMGWVGIDLSVPTAMISSVVLGLAVDSTILFLSRYRDERRMGVPRSEAVALMLESAGQSVSYSNLTLVCGFAVSIVSSFPPIRDFGLLSAATIAASYLGALLLLPAMIFAIGAHIRPETSGELAAKSVQ